MGKQTERPFARVRRELGLSLDQAAARLRLTPRYLRSLELSAGPLTQPLAARMSVAYGAALNTLTRPNADQQ
jgi:transcriptional regulator with XRE-family HTH domain